METVRLTALAVAAVLVIANAVLLWRNVTLNRELRGLVALTEANRQAADRLAEMGNPPIPYTPGMTLMPGQSTVIEVPLTLRPRERSY